MKHESSTRLKEFRLFTGLDINSICQHFKVDKDDWITYESGEKDAPLSLWFKVVKYVITQRQFFTSSTTASSDAADVVDSIDMQTVKIRDSVNEALASGKLDEKTATEVLNNTRAILDNLPKLYR